MKIRILILAASALLMTGPAFAGSTYVQGYMRSDGTYVQPHYRTTPDSNPYNNYSTQGNYNPYTGKAGTVDPYSQNYGSGTGSFSTPSTGNYGYGSYGHYGNR